MSNRKIAARFAAPYGGTGHWQVCETRICQGTSLVPPRFPFGKPSPQAQTPLLRRPGSPHSKQRKPFGVLFQPNSHLRPNRKYPRSRSQAHFGTRLIRSTPTPALSVAKCASNRVTHVPGPRCKASPRRDNLQLRRNGPHRQALPCCRGPSLGSSVAKARDEATRQLSCRGPGPEADILQPLLRRRCASRVPVPPGSRRGESTRLRRWRRASPGRAPRSRTSRPPRIRSR